MHVPSLSEIASHNPKPYAMNDTLITDSHCLQQFLPAEIRGGRSVGKDAAQSRRAAVCNLACYPTDMISAMLYLVCMSYEMPRTDIVYCATRALQNASTNVAYDATTRLR
eukprot:3941840-Rhodomonas_salina.1